MDEFKNMTDSPAETPPEESMERENAEGLFSEDADGEFEFTPKNGLDGESLADKVKVISSGKLMLKRFFRSKLSIIGFALILFLFLFCFVGPLLTGWGECTNLEGPYYGYFYEHYSMEVTDEATGETYTVEIVRESQNTTGATLPPFYKFVDGEGNTRIHILGTDKFGNDVFTDLMYGGRRALTLSFMTVLIITLLGVVIGGIAGYFGGWVDMVTMRIVDILTCIPDLPLMLILSSIFDNLVQVGVMKQEYVIYALMAVLTLISWTGVARLVRGQILYLREQDYMVASDALGFSTARKLFKHLIPNIMPQLIVSMTLSLGSMILYESTLSYLNLGVSLDTASWGKMINAAKTLSYNYPNIWAPSGVMIILTVLGFNFVGDGLRDALDPRMKK